MHAYIDFHKVFDPDGIYLVTCTLILNTNEDITG